MHRFANWNLHTPRGLRGQKRVYGMQTRSMIVTIDQEKRTVIVCQGAAERILPFSSPEAFEIISNIWLNCGWDTKYVYSFSCSVGHHSTT